METAEREELTVIGGPLDGSVAPVGRALTGDALSDDGTIERVRYEIATFGHGRWLGSCFVPVGDAAIRERIVATLNAIAGMARLILGVGPAAGWRPRR